MKTSIVVVAYNNVELVERCVQSVLDHSVGEYELIIVDNHSLDDRTRDYIQTILHDNVKYVDAGGNVGCHNGFNKGFENCTGDFLVKLDDDSVILTPGWNQIVIDSFSELEEIGAPPFAFMGVNSNVKQVTVSQQFKTPKEKNIEIIKSGVLGFSLVVIPRSTYELLGPLQSRFWADGEVKADSLYGGEELYYCQKAVQNGMLYGYCNDVKIHHLDNAERDPDYVLWKWVAGYRGWFGGDTGELKQDKEMLIRGYKDWLENGNTWHHNIANKRLEELGIKTFNTNISTL